MNNAISHTEMNIIAPTKLKILKREFSARKRRLLRAQVRNLLMS